MIGIGCLRYWCLILRSRRLDQSLGGLHLSLLLASQDQRLDAWRRLLNVKALGQSARVGLELGLGGPDQATGDQRWQSSSLGR